MNQKIYESVQRKGYYVDAAQVVVPIPVVLLSRSEALVLQGESLETAKVPADRLWENLLNELHEFQQTYGTFKDIAQLLEEMDSFFDELQEDLDCECNCEDPDEDELESLLLSDDEDDDEEAEDDEDDLELMLKLDMEDPEDPEELVLDDQEEGELEDLLDDDSEPQKVFMKSKPAQGSVIIETEDIEESDLDSESEEDSEDLTVEEDSDEDDESKTSADISSLIKKIRWEISENDFNPVSEEKTKGQSKGQSLQNLLDDLLEDIIDPNYNAELGARQQVSESIDPQDLFDEYSKRI